MQFRWVSVKWLEWMLVLSAEEEVTVSCKPETKQRTAWHIEIVVEGKQQL